ncbi:YceI family protein [Robertkochia sediminum]|uniref:YceI family protein n=1 Tax=Robertkochia sediminum TaxID=2785326 RepID=UPI0019332AA8|nr:YceI family protein [Robertkochia sediminum]MBL7471300.1 YceI family protein [Robertkochia sediminum]
MKHTETPRFAFLAALMTMLFVGTSVFGQTYTLDNTKSELTIFGTSNIHDWEITVEQQEGKITFNAGETPTVTGMEISIPVESLKSGKSGMDKNTYKAMDTKKHKLVTFTQTGDATLTAAGENTWKVKAKGDLTISGVTKASELEFTLKVANGSLMLNGEKSIDMTAFNVEPPTALLGTITTGKDVTLKFNTVLSK